MADVFGGVGDKLAGEGLCGAEKGLGLFLLDVELEELAGVSGATAGTADAGFGVEDADANPTDNVADDNANDAEQGDGGEPGRGDDVGADEEHVTSEGASHADEVQDDHAAGDGLLLSR